MAVYTLYYLFLLYLLYPFIKLFSAFEDMACSATLQDSLPLRVPTFYAPDDDGLLSLPVAICVAVTFGGIHCIAWSFHFPTFQEQLAWRISGAFMCGFPIFLVTCAILFAIFEIDSPSIGSATILGKIFRVFVPILNVMYVVARIILLVLPCIALRALPAEAFVGIQWSTFFPHIG